MIFSQFVARYVERSPLSLEKLSIQNDIVTHTTKDGTTHIVKKINCIFVSSRLVIGGSIAVA